MESKSRISSASSSFYGSIKFLTFLGKLFITPFLKIALYTSGGSYPAVFSIYFASSGDFALKNGDSKAITILENLR